MSTSYDVIMKKVCPQKKRNLNILQIFCKPAAKPLKMRAFCCVPPSRQQMISLRQFSRGGVLRGPQVPPFARSTGNDACGHLAAKEFPFWENASLFPLRSYSQSSVRFCLALPCPAGGLAARAEKVWRPKIGRRMSPVWFWDKTQICHRSMRKRFRATSKAPGSRISSRDARAAGGSGIPDSTHSSTKPVSAWV